VPTNGIIKGNCYNTFGSTCAFECSEGFEMSVGAASRTCNVGAGDVMRWSGDAVQCTGMQTRHSQIQRSKLILDPSGVDPYGN